MRKAWIRKMLEGIWRNSWFRLATFASVCMIGVFLSGACTPLMELAGTHPQEIAAPTVEGGDPARGRVAVYAYGCGSCHTIPKVAAANSTVGPPLTNWAERHYIAGAVPNEPEYLIQWIMNPQVIEPGTLMPDLAVTERDARDISAFLYTLHR